MHLSNNVDLDANDKFTKVRPILNMLNEKFMQFGVFSHHLSIDEEMVPYFGRHSAKMFISGKPIRFGFKIWCLASDTGYLFKFEPYSGKNTKLIDSGLGLVANVVLNLLADIQNPKHHNIYFDIFFTGFPLLLSLPDKGFLATFLIVLYALQNKLQKKAKVHMM